ncbi:MAG: cobyrinate a,c-diamide synthase [Pseudomonadota bacterium]|nr:cobyrinate a,c-diamide synthase [Pseudomonadota bacterium]MBU2026856.1 cobyrinate a,c-diamide synthase [Pseudomonadota bacterium]
MPRCPTLVIAGTHSGSGKTSLALALARALTRRGLAVQTFKVGPDFLDPTYLALASGRPCYNLDGWMAGREHVCRLFERAAADADVALVEGVMGLFDGADTAGPEGSTAEIARWLDAPILLVANVHGMARSLAALVRGFATFEPDLRIRGVVANHCGSERHAEWLADTLQAAGLPPLVGAIPRGAFPQLASRHLGLVTADERLLPEAVLDSLANALEQHLSLETLFPGWVETGDTIPIFKENWYGVPGFPARLRIGAARDAAFHFYYQDLFDTLATAGCETVFFSPLSDRRLPEGISGLYLGGGYPEAHAEALAANGEILAAIREYAASGKPLYAECGGLMYLSRGLLEAGGRFHPFLGILPARTRMLDGKKALGYVEITLTADSLWGRCGDVFRGHEFHYSELIDDPVADPAWRTVYALRRRRSEAVETEGFQKEAILASYTHLYYASLPAAIDHFIAHCGGTP